MCVRRCPKPERDALIAATALVHKLTVVTRNTKDFQYFRCIVIKLLGLTMFNHPFIELGRNKQQVITSISDDFEAFMTEIEQNQEIRRW